MQKLLHYESSRPEVWHLNKARLRTWDRYPVWAKTEGRELKQARKRKGWAGWVPNTKEERGKFKTRIACFGEPRSWIEDKDVEGLKSLQTRMAKAVT